MTAERVPDIDHPDFLPRGDAPNPQTGMRDTFKVHQYAAAKLKRYRAPKVNVAPVHVFKVDDAIWRAALREAGGDARRIEIVGRNEVIIHHHAR